ncbi:MAG: hypothetical protein ACOCUD_01655 [Bacillota bacterium]
MELKPLMKKLKKNKRGMSLGDLYPAILTIALIAILMAVVLYVLSEFGGQMENGSAAQDATDDVIDDFTDFVPWIGVILLIIAAAIVLGIVIRSFSGTGRV